MPPGSTPAHLDELFRRLEGIQPGKLTRVGPVFHDIAEQIRRRGLVVIISDLYDEPKEVLRGLRMRTRDMIAELGAMGDAVVKPADRWLAARGAPTIEELRRALGG